MFKEKTIKWMFVISMVLYFTYLLAFTYFVLAQKNINNVYGSLSYDFSNARFILPYDYIASIMHFALHVTITLIILSKLKNVYSTRAFEIVGICLFSGAFSFFRGFITDLQLISKRFDKTEEVLILNNILRSTDFVSFLANISITLFIVACSMSWYAKTIARNG